MSNEIIEVVTPGGTTEVITPQATEVIELDVGGQTGPRGPQGPIGPAGPQGPAGADGMDGAAGLDGMNGLTYVPIYVTAPNQQYTRAEITPDNTSRFLVYVPSNNANVFNADGTFRLSGQPLQFQNVVDNDPDLSLAQLGTQGPQGDTGPQGPIGPQGPVGPQGATGQGISSGAALPTTGTMAGDGFILVGEEHIDNFTSDNWTVLGNGNIQVTASTASSTTEATSDNDLTITVTRSDGTVINVGPTSAIDHSIEFSESNSLYSVTFTDPTNDFPSEPRTDTFTGNQGVADGGGGLRFRATEDTTDSGGNYDSYSVTYQAGGTGPVLTRRHGELAPAGFPASNLELADASSSNPANRRYGIDFHNASDIAADDVITIVYAAANQSTISLQYPVDNTDAEGYYYRNTDNTAWVKDAEGTVINRLQDINNVNVTLPQQGQILGITNVSGTGEVTWANISAGDGIETVTALPPDETAEDGRFYYLTTVHVEADPQTGVVSEYFPVGLYRRVGNVWVRSSRFAGNVIQTHPQPAAPFTNITIRVGDVVNQVRNARNPDGPVGTFIYGGVTSGNSTDIFPLPTLTLNTGSPISETALQQNWMRVGAQLRDTTPLNVWASGTTYAQNDQVLRIPTTGVPGLYYALRGNTGQPPESSPADWRQVGAESTVGALPQYDPDTLYELGDIISYRLLAGSIIPANMPGGPVPASTSTTLYVYIGAVSGRGPTRAEEPFLSTQTGVNQSSRDWARPAGVSSFFTNGGSYAAGAIVEFNRELWRARVDVIRPANQVAGTPDPVDGAEWEQITSAAAAVEVNGGIPTFNSAITRPEWDLFNRIPIAYPLNPDMTVNQAGAPVFIDADTTERQTELAGQVRSLVGAQSTLTVNPDVDASSPELSSVTINGVSYSIGTAPTPPHANLVVGFGIDPTSRQMGLQGNVVGTPTATIRDAQSGDVVNSIVVTSAHASVRDSSIVISDDMASFRWAQQASDTAQTVNFTVAFTVNYTIGGTAMSHHYTRTADFTIAAPVTRSYFGTLTQGQYNDLTDGRALTVTAITAGTSNTPVDTRVTIPYTASYTGATSDTYAFLLVPATAGTVSNALSEGFVFRDLFSNSFTDVVDYNFYIINDPISVGTHSVTWRA